MHFTDEYFHSLMGIYTRKDAPSIESVAELAGKTVSLPKGFYEYGFIERHYPQIKLLPTRNKLEAVEAVLLGNADVTLGFPAVINFLILEHSITNLRLSGKLTDRRFDAAVSVGVRKDWPILRDLLQKAKDSIGYEEQQRLMKRWLTLPDVHDAPRIDLSDQEQDFLKEHQEIRVAIDPGWAPIEFINEEGKPEGISAEYLKYLERVIGVRFKIDNNLDWQQAIEMAKNRKVDMFPSVSRTKEREGYLGFTDVYLSFPIFIYAAAETGYIGGVEALRGKRVAVVEDYAIHEWLQRDYPEIDMVPAKSIPDALEMLSSGQVYAFIGNSVSTEYYIQKLKLYPIHVAGETPYDYKQSMAVRNDWTVFLGILQKALDAMPQNEHDAIYNRWVSIRYEHGFDYALFWQVLVVVAVVLLLVFYWNRRLAVEVKERMRLAEQLGQAAEKANKAKSMFLANMSHELLTPLNTIIGFAQLMDQDTNQTQIQKDRVKTINRSGRHLLSLIDDVLDMSRIEAGEVNIEIQPCDFLELLDDISSLIRIRAEEVDLVYKLEMDPHLVRFVKTDARMIRQILLNLSTNAVKYTEQGGVVLHVGSRDVAQNRYMLSMAVEDSGKGISPDQQQIIFNPFSQLQEGERAYDGVGLGLAITRRFVDILRGDIRLESEVGKGSRFIVEIPVSIAAPGEFSEIHESDQAVRLAVGEPDFRMLVVDDDDDNRLLLSTMLEGMGFFGVPGK